MARRESKVAPAWWDYTTLDEGLLADAANMSVAERREIALSELTG